MIYIFSVCRCSHCVASWISCVDMHSGMSTHVLLHCFSVSWQEFPVPCSCNGFVWIANPLCRFLGQACILCCIDVCIVGALTSL